MKTLKILVPASLPFASRQTDTPLERGRHFFMEEIWKTIDGYEGYYQVSNMGRVKTLERWAEMVMKGTLCKRFVPERILNPSKDSFGYLVVGLCFNAKMKTNKVHRLVGAAFIPNPENKPQINHINAIKDDNRVENLEWATSKEDALHRVALKLQVNKKGADNPRSIPISQFTLDGTWVRDWAAAIEVQRETGFRQSSISACVKGNYKTAFGFIWKKQHENKN